MCSLSPFPLQLSHVRSEKCIHFSGLLIVASRLRNRIAIRRRRIENREKNVWLTKLALNEAAVLVRVTTQLQQPMRSLHCERLLLFRCVTMYECPKTTFQFAVRSAFSFHTSIWQFSSQLKVGNFDRSSKKFHQLRDYSIGWQFYKFILPLYPSSSSISFVSFIVIFCIDLINNVVDSIQRQIQATKSIAESDPKRLEWKFVFFLNSWSAWFFQKNIKKIPDTVA